MTKRNAWTEVIAQKVGKNYDEGVVVKAQKWIFFRMIL